MYGRFWKVYVHSDTRRATSRSEHRIEMLMQQHKLDNIKADDLYVIHSKWMISLICKPFHCNIKMQQESKQETSHYQEATLLLTDKIILVFFCSLYISKRCVFCILDIQTNANYILEASQVRIPNFMCTTFSKQNEFEKKWIKKNTL